MHWKPVTKAFIISYETALNKWKIPLEMRPAANFFLFKNSIRKKQKKQKYIGPWTKGLYQVLNRILVILGKLTHTHTDGAIDMTPVLVPSLIHQQKSDNCLKVGTILSALETCLPLLKKKAL